MEGVRSRAVRDLAVRKIGRKQNGLDTPVRYSSPTRLEDQWEEPDCGRLGCLGRGGSVLGDLE